MQKFTVFTIIFSVIIVTIVAELVIQDYLEKVYPPAGSIQASAISSDEFEFYYPDEQEPESEEESTEEEPEEESTNKVLEILEENRTEREPKERRESAEQEPESDFDLNAEKSTRIETLLPALNIPNLEYKPGIYNGKLFNLVSTDSIAIKESIYGFFEVDGQILGNFYEFEMKNTLLAESNLKKLKTLFDDFPEITSNQTNQFGDGSFYINHSVKVDQVFVVIQKDNFIYAFGYQNSFHEVFKAFFGVLL